MSRGDYLRFQKLIVEQSGLNFTEKKRFDLEAGLLKALQDAPDGIVDIGGYYRFLSQQDRPAAKTELQRLINLLTIGETHFFRNKAQFDALISHILPALIAHKREQAAAFTATSNLTPQLRLWSAGCATGEEPYSLAVLLKELIPDINRWNISILATDINQEFLAKAQEGIYPDWSFREDRAKQKRSIYFKQVGKRYQINREIREMVTFAQHNLMQDHWQTLQPNTAALDLIFCRNVTIYFGAKDTQKIVKKFHQSLVDGGWLVVGHSEPSLIGYQDFQVRSFPDCIVYHKTSRQIERGGGDFGSLELSDMESAGEVISTYSEEAVIADDLVLPVLAPTVPTPISTKNNQQLLPETPDIQESVQSFLSSGEVDRAVLLIEAKLTQLQDETVASLYCDLAQTYADQDAWVQARCWAEAAITMNPICAKAYYILALIDEHQGQFESAIKNLTKVIYLDPMQPLPHLNLATLYQKIDRNSLARRELNNVIRLLDDWPLERVIPETDGLTAKRLIDTAQVILAGLRTSEID